MTIRLDPGERFASTKSIREWGANMMSVDDTLEDEDYHEFGLLHENAAEWGLDLTAQPEVARHGFVGALGRELSYVRWGSDEPEIIFLHGGGQNAHTWDTVALALGRPAVAVDLPGHGRSYRRGDRNYGPWANAEAVAELLDAVAPHARAVVGMSLGGATTIRLAATRPDVCRRAVIVDVTPQVNDPSRAMTTMERGSVALIGGPPLYDSFDEMADAAIALSPFRAAAGVRRGVRHNSVRLPSGQWTWRYDLFGGPVTDGEDLAEIPGEDPAENHGDNWADFTPLWDDVSSIAIPALLVRGGSSRYVSDEDEAEMRRRCPQLEVAIVEGAGHAVQSDQPLALVKLIEGFVDRT
jgi:pimeloyl-ACP methyl ester carboxylesterase